MIKISKLKPNEDALKQKYDELVNQLIYSVKSLPPSNLSLDYRNLTNVRFADYCRESIKNSELEEIWLNPNDISKIEVRSVQHSNEKYLKIYMHNGDTYDANGESVQEFFLKNVIFGNDV